MARTTSEQNAGVVNTTNPKPETMFAPTLTARRKTPCFHRFLPFLISLTSSNDNILSFGVVVSAFTPSQPTKNVILRNSSRASSNLYGLLDSLGGIFSGPKLEAEKNLPYDPPFSSELSIAGGVRTFAIKERP